MHQRARQSHHAFAPLKVTQPLRIDLSAKGARCALDRIADAALLLGFSWFYMSNLVDMAVNPQRVLINLQRGLEPLTWAVIAMLAMLAAVGSLLVSYTRARAEGLGIDPKDVQSPTFTLVREHEGSGGRLLHLDLYRLEPDDAWRLLGQLSRGLARAHGQGVAPAAGP